MLTQEDKHLLFDQRNGEFHRVFLKAIESYKASILSEICRAESEKDLFRLQGRLLGLQMCSNIVAVFGVDSSKPTTPSRLHTV